jgi:hypothetical protein
MAQHEIEIKFWPRQQGNNDPKKARWFLALVHALLLINMAG